MRSSRKILPLFIALGLFWTTEAQALCRSVFGNIAPCPCLFACTGDGYDQVFGQVDMSTEPLDPELEVKPENNALCSGDPVYLHSGQFYYQCGELQVPGQQLDVSLAHTY